MTAAPRASPGGLQAFTLHVIALSLLVRPFSSQCVDGTYRHEGRDCCLCGVGLHLVKHCTENLKYGKCEHCKPGTYSSEPTSQMSCEPCTSCSQTNDNLEEDEPCTPGTNRKCRCKKDHYCSSAEVCKLCYPCNTCVPEGIKVPCTARNNTVCNDKAADGQPVGTIVAIVVAVLLSAIIVGIGIVYIWRKKCRPLPISNKNPPVNEMEPLKAVDLQHHLPDIADIIGWKNMKYIAISTKISQVKIDEVERNNPHDHHERTVQLLGLFTEQHSTDAAQKLIERLRKKGKNQQADSVERLLRTDV